ncbi:unnamed protein product [Lathyrus oleraceus]|uniref:uncharacterized protein LOC127098439 isoform X2 n=1 Tax=Pisum sativum TaxID=3888 RepID=UPI0021CF7898|nr:uncharacterized protein LOC127098439 isoform X2 [Pisum sativum]
MTGGASPVLGCSDQTIRCGPWAQTATEEWRVRVQPSRKLKLNRGKTLIQRSSCVAFGFLDSDAFNNRVHKLQHKQEEVINSNMTTHSLSHGLEFIHFCDSRIREFAVFRNVPLITIRKRKENIIEIESGKLTGFKLGLRHTLVTTRDGVTASSTETMETFSDSSGFHAPIGWKRLEVLAVGFRFRTVHAVLDWR